MKYLLIFLLSIIIFSCNTKESNNNNTDKAAINLDESTDNNINKTEQSNTDDKDNKSNNSSINTNETEETTYYSYTDKEIISFIESGDFQTIKKLIESKSLDVNYNLEIDEYSKSTPLIKAIEYKQTDIINYLLENNADINLKEELTGFTPLMASFHNIAIAELLIEKGADIEARNVDGINALVYAVSLNDEEMVKFLLAKGADANTVCEIENEHIYMPPTPLMNAVYNGNTNIINMLLENGADINYTNDSDMTPLIYAAYKGNTNIINTLLENGADINYTNYYGMTALMYAASYNQFEAVKILLENNADTSITDEDGRTALDWAKLENFEDIVELLEEYN
ncbi:ankyrin repeat-containing protein [Brachyspira intermedia PWS/A]|uniref:Ankyrin repeat-containing protein n=1 Tax=Brachyspira intermedia (strain ATCC 51140 / PWS/A) TaxID=1045858 RepID=G0EPJ6_BRAIP|nr:ankyrin repeat domain-containing protein [Brachyspira intermedia]AEM23266.1 ankyrin repeat-containing protein [Brachyspira intermedia PWS/A]